jgi:hypothetical protein
MSKYLQNMIKILENQNENATLKINSTLLCHVVVSPRGFLAFFLGKYLLRHF